MEKAKYGSGFRLYDYYKTVARTGSVFSALSLSFLLCVVYYMFYNYIYGEMKAEIASNNALKYATYAIGAIICILIVIYLVVKVTKKWTNTVDVALITVGVADIVIMTVKFGINHDIKSREEILLYAIPLACTFLLSIVRWICFKPRYNYLISTHGEKSNSTITKYYVALFKKPATIFMALLGVATALVFLLAQVNGWFDIFALSDSAKDAMTKHCGVFGGIAGVLFIIALAIRLYNKTINFTDSLNFSILVAGIVLISAYVANPINLTLYVSAGAIVISLVLQIVFALTTYITDTVVYEAPEIKQEKPQVEQKKEVATVQEKVVVVQSVDEKAINEKFAKLESTIAFLLRKVEYLESGVVQTRVDVKDIKENINTQSSADQAFIADSIDEIARRLNIAEQAIINNGNEIHKQVGDKRFVYRAIEKLDSRLTFVESELKQGVVVKEKTEYIEKEPEQKIIYVAKPDDVELDEQAEIISASEAPENIFESGDISWEEVESNQLRAKPKFSFDMKLRIADDEVKQFYSEIKNALLAYGVHARLSANRENFNKGRNPIARMVINGKTLKVYLAVNPNEIDPKVYRHKDVSDKKGVAELPTMINVRSKIAVKKVKMLIDKIAEDLVIFPKKYEPVDFAKDLTTDGFTTVECKGYGYVVNKKGIATREDAEKIPNDFVANVAEYVNAEQKPTSFVKTRISLEELEKNFENSDTINLNTLKEKGLAAADSNYLIIDDSDRLCKRFKVYADEYTAAAVKMICIAGGEVYKIMQPEN